jgi:hypothetical protein
VFIYPMCAEGKPPAFVRDLRMLARVRISRGWADHPYCGYRTKSDFIESRAFHVLSLIEILVFLTVI